MRSRVAASPRPLPLSACETVVTDIPTAPATSRMVGRRVTRGIVLDRQNDFAPIVRQVRGVGWTRVHTLVEPPSPARRPAFGDDGQTSQARLGGDRRRRPG